MKQVEQEQSQNHAQELEEEVQKRLKFIEKKKQLDQYISSLKSNDIVIKKQSNAIGKSMTASNSNSKLGDDDFKNI